MLAKNCGAVQHLHGYVRWVHNKLPRNHILSGKTGLGAGTKPTSGGASLPGGHHIADRAPMTLHSHIIDTMLPFRAGSLKVRLQQGLYRR